jgi:hypothetical protein
MCHKLLTKFVNQVGRKLPCFLPQIVKAEKKLTWQVVKYDRGVVTHYCQLIIYLSIYIYIYTYIDI